MPSINLRLSKDEHAALERWAHDSHRSLQKEIVWRLFSGELAENLQVEKIGAATTEPREAIEVPPDGTEATISAKRRMHPCKHHLPPSKHCPYGCDG